ncbi:MAG: hypothetical protein PHR77_14755 [Kiritimatiellae bacterium]|nr:hypothetical protein [Kiritimatiellia bacterium]MDD5520683.1 hypothetical protein [Kiritimatiellia bacterium]
METSNIDKNTEMPNNRDEAPSSQGVFLPIAIFMIAVLLILGWELYLTKSQSLIWQKQIVQREQLANQARAVQSDLQKIAFNLITLSTTNPDAKTIVEKYQIKQSPDSLSPVQKR